jgi:hypothetical protein
MVSEMKPQKTIIRHKDGTATLKITTKKTKEPDKLKDNDKCPKCGGRIYYDSGGYIKCWKCGFNYGKVVEPENKQGEIIKLERRYYITSKKIRELFDIKGEIIQVGLWSGRSPNDVVNKVSPDNDVWFIETKEGELL